MHKKDTNFKDIILRMNNARQLKNNKLLMSIILYRLILFILLFQF